MSTPKRWHVSQWGSRFFESFVWFLGTFNDYVDKKFPFLTTYPPLLTWTFQALKVDKNKSCWTNLSRLIVHEVIENLLSFNFDYFDPTNYWIKCSSIYDNSNATSKGFWSYCACHVWRHASTYDKRFFVVLRNYILVLSNIFKICRFENQVPLGD